MGWVTLSLRRMEDHCLVNNLELQLIGLSRRRMQLLRGKNKQRTEYSKEQQTKLDELKGSTDLTSAQNELRDKLNAKSSAGSDISDDEREALSDAVNTASQKYSLAQSTYSEEKEAIKNTYDTMLDELEEETTEAENELDMEQAEIEAQLEAARGELEAVKQQISSDVQSTTIKLG